jgi:hypothetical protein
VEAHANDLRAEVDDPTFAEAVKEDWRSAHLSTEDAALCEYAEKLTQNPAHVIGSPRGSASISSRR